MAVMSESTDVLVTDAGVAGEDTETPSAAELLVAMQEIEEQLAALEELLQAEPGNEEAAQIRADMADALASTQAAYSSLQQQQPAPAGAASPAPAPAAAAAEQQQQQHWQPAVRAHLNMHPANLYSSREPDFAALAALYPPLARHVTVTTGGRALLDFTSWEATKELTAALLAADFGVVWQLPAGQLVPPVPNRANYIHWLHDLLQLSSPPGAVVRGLDIGCGANFIYCLLGAAIYGWAMTGVDITPVALTAAAGLIAANPRLSPLLEVRTSRCCSDNGSGKSDGSGDTASKTSSAGSIEHVEHHLQQQQQQLDAASPAAATAAGSSSRGPVPAVLGPLQGALQNEVECFHFCMCNPPFFETLAEAGRNPNTACGGTAAEMVCPGGELSFIRAMVADSRQLRGRIHWYSSMCGKKATLKALRQDLHNAGVTALRTTELAQGKTIRWAVAWSFAANPNTASMPLPRREFRAEQQQSHGDGEQLLPKKRGKQWQQQQQQKQRRQHH